MPVLDPANEFARSLAMLVHEGGYSNHGDDPGGATMKASRSASSWLHDRQPVSTGLVAALADLGPRGTEALFNRWFRAKLSGK